MGIPKVAIVGRPNVGKSSLLNWVAGKLLSVVDPTAGVTRDRVTWIVNEGDRYFELIDTGGIGIVDSDDLSDDIERQIDVGLLECDLLLFVVDAKSGITPLDKEVGERLRKINKPKLMVVNKCDSQNLDIEATAFLSLAMTDQVITSVKGNRNRKELLQAIAAHLPPPEESESEEGAELLQTPELRLAIVGRRNVGKSTFTNQLAQEERVIVSEVAGTTRDSIDIRFDVDGHTLVAIDTPGVRKKKSLANNIEFYGLVRAQRSIRRADVVLMFFDAVNTISKVDKQLVEEITKHHKPCVFVVNKWDLAKEEGMTIEKWAEYLFKTFATMRHAPVAVLTARDGRNIRQLINLTQSIFKQSRTRMGTGKLNRALKMAIQKNPPPYRKNRRPKIYYASQVAVAPPTLVVKCNDPKLFDESWKRYLLGFLREVSPFQEVPIRLLLKSRSDEEFALGDIALRHEVSDSDFADDDEDFDETTNVDETPDPIIAEDDLHGEDGDDIDEFIPLDYDVDDGTDFEQSSPTLLDDVDADSESDVQTDVAPDRNS
ncbi:MAG: ribosome biogenesis GTPase Der [Planctomycetaceae bacterium]|nr:ribosome biogenesis GTPase Der [Planctomycetaceae bacterium]